MKYSWWQNSTVRLPKVSRCHLAPDWNHVQVSRDDGCYSSHIHCSKNKSDNLQKCNKIPMNRCEIRDSLSTIYLWESSIFHACSFTLPPLPYTFLNRFFLNALLAFAILIHASYFSLVGGIDISLATPSFSVNYISFLFFLYQYSLNISHFNLLGWYKTMQFFLKMVFLRQAAYDRLWAISPDFSIGFSWSTF